MKKFISKLKDAWELLTAEEYFLTTANEDTHLCTPGVYPRIGPIRYSYSSNTDRKTFYIFVKDHITNFILDDEDND